MSRTAPSHLPPTLIHIGMPKCASTWLQRQLFRRQNGYVLRYRPVEAQLVFVDPTQAQWQVPQKLLGLKRAGGLVPTISGEMLAGNPLTGGADRLTVLARLQEVLPRSKILIVIREQSDMFRSLYKLLINWGYSQNPSELIQGASSTARQGFNLDYLCYDLLIDMYQQAFGKDNVLVLPFELLRSSPEAFVATINRFSETPVDVVDVDMQKIINPGKNMMLNLELKRFCNRYIAKTEYSPVGVYRPANIHQSFNFSTPRLSILEQHLLKRFRGGLEQVIREHCGYSNKRTINLTGLDLTVHGYSVG